MYFFQKKAFLPCRFFRCNLYYSLFLLKKNKRAMANRVDDFILALPLEKQALADYLRRKITAIGPHLVERMSFGLPFFYGKKGVVYLNPKPQGIDLGFMQGHLLTPRPHLIVGKRKQVRSLYFSLKKDVDLDLLQNVLQEAIAIDSHWPE